ncbi:transmembrane protein 182 isoform X3 [Mirounga angustirostris]|uniref:transmembrane protein 182 isoform X3 n=1 Tax=Mirounga angustirostris TaxID=9716 RepID=UPI0023E44975|nr:transmembrane protein 182 isoform X2 [Mirounga angustirostris]
MRLNIAVFFGALFGALGVLLFLVAFGSDYWLLATEVGKCSGEQNIENVTFHHEGFFWRCWFNGIAEENDSSIWKFWYTNQPPSKNCAHAYLSPYPFMRGEHNSTSYDSAIIYRGFWAVLMLLGVVAVVTASFLIICAAPFASHVLYKAGGGGYIAGGGPISPQSTSSSLRLGERSHLGGLSTSTSWKGILGCSVFFSSPCHAFLSSSSSSSCSSSCCFSSSFFWMTI